jgi:hypothetical protein
MTVTLRLSEEDEEELTEELELLDVPETLEPDDEEGPLEALVVPAQPAKRLAARVNRSKDFLFIMPFS